MSDTILQPIETRWGEVRRMGRDGRTLYRAADVAAAMGRPGTSYMRGGIDREWADFGLGSESVAVSGEGVRALADSLGTRRAANAADEILDCPDEAVGMPAESFADPVTLSLCECLRIVTDLAVRLAEIDLGAVDGDEAEAAPAQGTARTFHSVTGSTARVTETPTGWLMSATVDGRRRLSREFQTEEDAVRALALVDEGWREER